MNGTLSDVVSVERRFRRSVRIGAGSAPEDLDGFVCTASAAQALRTTMEHVAVHRHGAFTWTGPYGCGKSTLAQVLASVLGPPGQSRSRALASLPPALSQDLVKGFAWRKPGWTVVPVLGRRADASDLVAAALEAQGISGPDPIAALVSASASRPGVLLVIDEMGKLLEHAAASEGDPHFFQELAEAASRTEGRLVVVGVLHQAFDDYAYRLARETRDDWLKVQGRFVDVPLSPTGEEQLELLSRAITVSVERARSPAMEIVADAVGRSERAKSAVRAQLEACWPLNPVVACMLGPISRRRFGQSQRSIFGFLGSAEPFGFQDFLQSTAADEPAQYDVPRLWDYLRANLEPSILASPDGHRWSIAIDALERTESRDLEDGDVPVLKTVALLDLFRERSGLLASPAVIEAGTGLGGTEVEAALSRLVRRSALINRRHLGAYSLYAGSDFDIEAAVATAAGEGRPSDYGRLRSTGVLTPILAKRDYHEFGAMRWFDVDVSTLDDAEARVAAFRPAPGAAGLFLLLINEQGDAEPRVRRLLDRLVTTIGDRPIAFGVSRDAYMLRELTQELVALERVQATRAELKGDPVARREVASRIVRLAGELEERLRAGFETASWRVPAIGENDLSRAGASGGLSVIASRMAAALYPAAPRMRNELLNRSKPSANAMGALRLLMTAMITSGDQPRLGIRDFPAEGGLYASILEQTGLHGNSGEEGIGFKAPAPDDPSRLSLLWERASEILREAGSDGATLAQIFAVWRDRPFGVKNGLLPALGLAYLLSRRSEVSVYLDGVFSSNLGDLLVDRLLQDASALRLRLNVLGQRDAAILEGISDLVQELSGAQSDGGDLLAVGRRLVGIVVGLPGWVRRTSRLDGAALRVRDLAAAAHDPNKFMLDDLPALVGGDASVEQVIATVREGLISLRQAYPALLASLRELLAAELRVRNADLAKLRERAKKVSGITGNYRLDAFATRLSSYDGGDEALEGIASLAANKPPRDWVDRDVDAARVETAALAREFLRAEGLAHVQGRDVGRFSFAVFLSDPARPGLVAPEVSIDGEDLVRARSLAAALRSVVGDKVGRDVALAAAAELAALLAEEMDVEPLRQAGGSR